MYDFLCLFCDLLLWPRNYRKSISMICTEQPSEALTNLMSILHLYESQLIQLLNQMKDNFIHFDKI